MKNIFYKKACPSSRMVGKMRGITVVELLVVIAVIGIIILIAFPQFSRMRENQLIKNATVDVLSVIEKARSQTLSSLNSSEYGVRFQPDQVIIFKGKVFSGSAVDNETIDIIPPASISNITLNEVSGSEMNMYFNRLSGVPSASGTITINTTNIQKIITISATGMASVN